MYVKKRRRVSFLARALLPALALLATMFTLLPLVSCSTLRQGEGNAARGRRARPGVTSLTLVAVGDNLIHIEIIDDAVSTAHTGGYNFEPVYSEVKPLIEGADIAFINQETPIAGAAFGYSGYPEFNGPREIGDALRKTGFTVINHATNHTLDKGASAVDAVLDYWDAHPGAVALGIHRSAEGRAAQKVIITKNNISVGWLAYTYGTNGIALPKDKPWLVSLIDTERMAAEIDALRPLCDFLVVSMHWGEEYQHTPSKRQRELADFLAARKVDVVIGHHPHVLQPVASLARADGGQTLVFFSLGNFVSFQKEKARLLGALARITLTKTTHKVAPPDLRVSDAEIIPLVTHYEEGGKAFKVYPLSAYTEKLHLRHGIHQYEAVPADYFGRLYAGIFKTLDARALDAKSLDARVPGTKTPGAP